MKKKLYYNAEDVVSGRGILHMYNFLMLSKVKHDKVIKLQIQNAPDSEKPALITKYALEDKDVLCIRTLELFIKYYARLSRNFALTTLCSELILAGGIAPKILSAMQDVFVDEFVAHDIFEIKKFLEKITILVITDPDVSLYGVITTRVSKA